MNQEENIKIQRQNVFDKDSKVRLFAPCRVGEGILQIKKEEKDALIEQFKQKPDKHVYFIPSSGSGSRMFQFLYEFLNNPEESDLSSIEKFINNIDSFAFYHLLPNEMKDKIKENTLDAEELAAYILHEEGLNFDNAPKGLIPFHFDNPFVLNPFQEHVLQGTRVSNGNAKFHFTIQQEFEQRIKNSISNLEGLTGKKYQVTFSTQSNESDSYAFYEDGKIATETNVPIRRPAGHGALLNNLNQLDEELIFIKNIDNVQHFNRSESSMESWAVLGGLLQKFRKSLRELANNPSKAALATINEEYQFLSPTELNNVHSEETILKIINRPNRVCGMVKNNGQPGGGPFWIDDNGEITKQIVEKAQIDLHGEQFRLMVKSTHFNPVMIALCPRNLQNEKLNLNNYSDESKFFVVNKSHKGKEIKFMELPGLWNGGMANWNTLFIELNQNTFSPVKTVLDLLQEEHRG